MRKMRLGRNLFMALLGVGLVCLGLMGGAGFALAGGKKPPSKKGKAKKQLEMPTKTQRDWPPGEVASAKAYTFNFDTEFGPGLSLFAYKDGKWNENMRSEHVLDVAQIDLAMELTHRTRGGVDVSKCPLPRHAVVFFDKDGEPLGSVNVCFECGDILVWPPYYADAEEAYDIKYSEMHGKGDEAMPLIIAVYEEVMPQWEMFFKDLGEPLEPPKKAKPKKVDRAKDG